MLLSDDVDGPNTVLARQWDGVYQGTPPWEIGRPQQAFRELAERGLLAGRVLDVGCGTGRTALLAAQSGATAVGFDISRRAAQLARDNAAAAGVEAQFFVADALAFTWDGDPFDVVVDSGTFHLFGLSERRRYVARVAAVVQGGSRLYLLCARRGRTGSEWGPPGLSEAEIADSFGDGWSVESVLPAVFEVQGAPVESVEAQLATVVRQ